MGDAIKSAGKPYSLADPCSENLYAGIGSSSGFSSLLEGSTAFKTGSYGPVSSGTSLKKKTPRKRPYKSRRKPRTSKPVTIEGNELVPSIQESPGINKRKAESAECHNATRMDLQEVAPKGGLPNHQ
ncbi:unnamed protein product [Cochlearia groenlandica]